MALIVIASVALTVFLLPLIPLSGAAANSCVYCSNVSGVDFASIGYYYLGIGVFHTVRGAFGFEI